MPVSLSDNGNESPRFDNHNATEQPAEGSQGVAIDNHDDPNFDPSSPKPEDESPYPEVRSAVANTDDPTMLSSTLRSWVIGLIWVVLVSGTNQFLFLRYPTVIISPIAAQVLSLPIGKAWARYVPNIILFGIPLNPGPFTIKEHVIITVMACVSEATPYATSVIAVQKVFYNQHVPFGYQWLLVMSTQLIGFSIGGICNRFLVAPPSMIWPEMIATAGLFNTLHAQETSGSRKGSRTQGGISRRRFFYYVFIGHIFYNFSPSYLFTALSSFSWVCWIAPHNPKINQLFGVTHGLAMGVLTFDWGQITAFAASPLASPWWSMANAGTTIVLFYWILLPILYYTNVWYGAYLPMVSSYSFDNTGRIYNVSRIVNPDFSFNLQSYKEYSPLFISTSFAIRYGLSFASITATLTHTFFYYRKQLWTLARRRSPPVNLDIHARLMSAYKEVPDWWYLIIFLSTFVFGVVTIKVWDTQFPAWAFVLSLLISFVCAVPFGVIQAATNQEVTLNVVAELIVGYALPGRPIANMMFKTWGYVPVVQALLFTGNLKLGHYMKIPPRSMFFCMVVAAVVAGTVQLGVQAWMLSNIEGICSPDQKDGFICPTTAVFGTESIIWGVIGPQRLFSHGQLYFGLSFFLVGALAPLFQWILHKKFRIDFLKYLNFPVVFSGAVYLPPATPLNYVPAVLVCFIFNYAIRRHHFGWWSKYNYVLSGALDAGYDIGILIVFFALQYPKNGKIGLNNIQTWWGNTVYTKTDDYVGVPYRSPPEGGTFGPSSW